MWDQHQKGCLWNSVFCGADERRTRLHLWTRRGSVSAPFDPGFYGSVIGLFLFPIADRLIGLPESRARNHNRPQQVPALAGTLIQDVAVGAEHTLALSSTGDVYAWGSNSEGQVRPDTHTPPPPPAPLSSV